MSEPPGEFPPHPQSEPVHRRHGKHEKPSGKGKIIGTGLGVAGILLAAFLITGLWTPGFLTSEDDRPTPSAVSPSTQEPTTTTSSQKENAERAGDEKAVADTARRATKAFNDRDQAGFKKYLCKGQRNILKGAPTDASLKVNGAPRLARGGDEATVPMRLKDEGKPKDGTVTFGKQSGDWCMRTA